MSLLRRVLPIMVLAMGAEALPAAALDLSDYRQNTYGPPNHYCNPTRPLSSNGTGTLADPWNMSQCATQPVAGDVVGILPGVSVDLPTTNSAAFPPSIRPGLGRSTTGCLRHQVRGGRPEWC